MAFRHVDGMWRIKRKLNILNEYYIKKDIEIMDSFISDVLNNRQEKLSRISDENNTKYHDIISLFIKQSKNKLTKFELKNIAMNMIIAGRDTTRLLISWWIYEMTKPKHNNIKQNVINEINNYIETNNTNIISYNDASNKLRYLEATLLESLRLNPVVPFLIRRCCKNIKLPDGTPIFNESIQVNEVIIPTYAYGRNPNIWNEPLIFKPERFISNDVNINPVTIHDVHKYPFFNINPRLCLGRHLAILEAKIFLFYFISKYNFDIIPNQNIKIKTGIVLNMTDGLYLKINKKRV